MAWSIDGFPNRTPSGGERSSPGPEDGADAALEACAALPSSEEEPPVAGRGKGKKTSSRQSQIRSTATAQFERPLEQPGSGRANPDRS
jgi:hypothetical protein